MKEGAFAAGREVIRMEMECSAMGKVQKRY